VIDNTKNSPQKSHDEPDIKDEILSRAKFSIAKHLKEANYKEKAAFSSRGQLKGKKDEGGRKLGTV